MPGFAKIFSEVLSLGPAGFQNEMASMPLPGLLMKFV